MVDYPEYKPDGSFERYMKRLNEFGMGGIFSLLLLIFGVVLAVYGLLSGSITLLFDSSRSSFLFRIFQASWSVLGYLAAPALTHVVVYCNGVPLACRFLHARKMHPS